MPAGPEGPRGPEGPEGPQGETGPAGASPVTRFARVSDTGVLVAGSPGTTAARSGLGDYQVTFDRDVSGCAYGATANDFDRNVATAPRPGASSTVDVIVDNGDNAVADVGFYLLVYC